MARAIYDLVKDLSQMKKTIYLPDEIDRKLLKLCEYHRRQQSQHIQMLIDKDYSDQFGLDVPENDVLSLIDPKYSELVETLTEKERLLLSNFMDAGWFYIFTPDDDEEYWDRDEIPILKKLLDMKLIGLDLLNMTLYTVDHDKWEDKLQRESNRETLTELGLI